MLSRATIQHGLGLTDEGIVMQRDEKKEAVTTTATLHPNLRLFSAVGDRLRGSTDLMQRTRFFRELDKFMEKVESEHEYRMSGGIPPLEEYMDIRCGSVGCAPQIALTE